MDIRRLPAEEAAVRRYIEELWIPYNRELETILDDFALAEDVDVVAAELDFRLDRLGSEDFRGWVAVDGGTVGDAPADTEGEFAGFVTTTVDESATVFDRPDRLVICDIYVREPYRGTGLARRLVERARTRATETGCDQLVLDVDVENERALAFYEKLGFDSVRHRMVVDVTDD